MFLAFFSLEIRAIDKSLCMDVQNSQGKCHLVEKVRFMLTQQNSEFLSLRVIAPYHASPSFLAIELCIDGKSRECRTSSYIYSLFWCPFFNAHLKQILLQCSYPNIAIVYIVVQRVSVSRAQLACMCPSSISLQL